MNWYLKVLKQYVDFNGRARRKEFWMFVLINMIISMIFNYIGAAINFTLLGSIYSLAVLLPNIAVAIRRMHDIGKSGWFILIPIYNIILAATAGVEGENEYGPDPKAEETAA